MANFENGIKVGIKIRPLNSKESVNEYTSTYHLIPEIHSLVYSPNQCQNKQIFQSDYLFDENEPIEGIYHLICHTMIERVIDGYEGALFAYGMTSVGKTFTMQGGEGSIGLVQLSTYDLIRSLNLRYSLSEFRVMISYVEVYNENVKDLLSESIEDSNVVLREDKNKGMVSSASEYAVNSYKDAIILFKKGNTRRSVEATAMNYDSSRSHTIFKLVVEVLSPTLPSSPTKSPIKSLNPTTPTKSTPTTPVRSKQPQQQQLNSSPSPSPRRTTPTSTPLSKKSAPCTPSSPSRSSVSQLQFRKSGVLYLVDLAGSESVRMTGSSGLRVKESGRINQSLLSLGRVIHSLSSQLQNVSQNSSHIAYRDSKLTRLLQPVLSTIGKGGSIWMLCCITLASWCAEETRNTLEFADDIRLMRTMGFSSKSTNSLHMKRLKETKAELLHQANLVEEALIISEDGSGDHHEEESIPAVGSVDGIPSFTSVSPMRSIISRQKTQLVDDFQEDQLTTPTEATLPKKSDSLSSLHSFSPQLVELSPVHSYIDLNEVERIWTEVDDPIAALLHREEKMKRQLSIEFDSGMKSASISLEKMKESAETEAKIWAQTIESSRIKAAIDAAEFSQKRAKIEAVRIKAAAEKVQRLQAQAEAMARMKQEIYERLCMEIEEVHMRRYNERLIMVRELTNMSAIEKECREYERKKKEEEKKEEEENDQMIEEELTLRLILEQRKEYKERLQMEKEDKMTREFMEWEREVQEGEMMETETMRKEEDLMRLFVERERELQERLQMKAEEQLMMLFVEKEKKNELKELLEMNTEEVLMRNFFKLEQELLKEGEQDNQKKTSMKELIQREEMRRILMKQQKEKKKQEEYHRELKENKSKNSEEDLTKIFLQTEQAAVLKKEKETTMEREREMNEGMMMKQQQKEQQQQTPTIRSTTAEAKLSARSHSSHSFCSSSSTVSESQPPPPPQEVISLHSFIALNREQVKRAQSEYSHSSSPTISSKTVPHDYRKWTRSSTTQQSPNKTNSLEKIATYETE